MKILIIDTALAADLARRLAIEGHEVYFFVNWIRAHPVPEETEYARGIFERFGIKRVSNFYSMLEKVDLVVVTDVGWMDDVEYLRDKGIPIFGGGGAEILELDRGRAKDIAEEVGVKIPHTWDFKNADAALKAMREFEDGKYVIKVNLVGDAFTKTYVSVNKEDAIHHIRLLKEKHADAMGLTVEEFIEGIEYAVGGFFNGSDFVGEFCFNFEHKRYFNDDYGPLTGEMGTVIFWECDGKLARENLLKFKNVIADLGYTGYIDMNFIVNEKGAYLLEFTSRFGFPLLSGQLVSMSDINFGQFMYDCARGKKPDFEIPDDKRWCVIVCVNTPPIFQGERYVIYDLDLNNLNIGIADILLENDLIMNVPVSSALYERLLNCCGTGSTISDAIESAYSLVNSIRVKDMVVRTDIGRKVRDEYLNYLALWGYDEVLQVRRNVKKGNLLRFR